MYATGSMIYNVLWQDIWLFIWNINILILYIYICTKHVYHIVCKGEENYIKPSKIEKYNRIYRKDLSVNIYSI